MIRRTCDGGQLASSNAMTLLCPSLPENHIAAASINKAIIAAIHKVAL